VSSYTVELTPQFDLEYERTGDGEWLVIERFTGDWGEGETLPNALQDFYDTERTVLRILDENPLSAPMDRQRAYIRERLDALAAPMHATQPLVRAGERKRG
jgi:hypothetical protein